MTVVSVAVKELKLSCHNGYIYIYVVLTNKITEAKFLKSNPVVVTEEYEYHVSRRIARI